MKKNPLVSVIVNCFNGEKYLKYCIQSIFHQTYKNWEIIFWDNSSQDNSIKIIKSFRSKKIKIFKSKKFNTLYKSRNLAIRKAKGKYISFLDTDDLWKKNYLKTFVNKIKKKDYDIICSNYDKYSEKNKKRKINQKKIISKTLSTQFLLNNYVIGILAVFIKKSIFKKYNFSQKYDIIGDFDLFLRLSKKFKIYYINESLAIYRYHQKNLSTNNLNCYIDEIKHWLSLNKKKKDNKNFDFSSIELILIKLRLKKIIKKIFGRVVQW